ncbi:hypothetical protein [Streptomyces sp. NPDC055094]
MNDQGRDPGRHPDVKAYATEWETAVLDGGPADGMRMRVTDRPAVVQVTYPCELEGPSGGAQAVAVYVYRRDPRVQGEPLRYGIDRASP